MTRYQVPREETSINLTTLVNRSIQLDFDTLCGPKAYNATLEINMLRKYV